MIGAFRSTVSVELKYQRPGYLSTINEDRNPSITNKQTGENRNASSSSAMVLLELIHSQLTASPDEDQHISREKGRDHYLCYTIVRLWFTSGSQVQFVLLLFFKGSRKRFRREWIHKTYQTALTIKTFIHFRLSSNQRTSVSWIKFQQCCCKSILQHHVQCTG